MKILNNILCIVPDVEEHLKKMLKHIYKFNLFSVVSPLTKVKLINELNEREADLGVKESVSWHTEYKDSAWIFVGKIVR